MRLHKPRAYKQDLTIFAEYRLDLITVFPISYLNNVFLVHVVDGTNFKSMVCKKNFPDEVGLGGTIHFGMEETIFRS